MNTRIEATRIHTPTEVPDAPASTEVEATPRSTRAEQDASITARAAARLDTFAADFFSLLETYQARTRDTTTQQQEQTANSRSAGAQTAADIRRTQLDQAIRAQQDAASLGPFMDVMKWVGVGLSLVVGTVGALFTGGASLVASVALAVALAATCVTSALGEIDGIDQEALGIANIVIAAVATAVSFGGSAATLVSAGSQTAVVVLEGAIATAVQVLQSSLQLVNAGVSLSSALMGGFAADDAHQAANHTASADRAAVQRDLERDGHETAVAMLGDLMSSFRRVAESMQEVRDTRNEAMRLATSRLC